MTDGATPSTLSGPTRAPTSTRRAVLNTIRGSAGNLVEWYDVYVYTVFATYFEAQFFDKNDENSTLYIYAIFAVTFVMRPVGSWFFGRYADRRGRKAALMLSITVMSSCSFLVAVMPTRELIGYWAAVILVLARLVQGFATGGEYGTSATYMSEAATANRRGFLSSFQYVTLIGGHVLAQFTLLIALQFLDGDALRAWGWRIGFFIGGVAALVVLWIRRSMDESLSESHLEAIREGKDRDAGSMKTLFTMHWRPLLLVFLITAGGTVAFYTYSVNAPAIVKSITGVRRLKCLELAGQQSRRHEMPLSLREPLRDQLLGALEIDDADVAASMHEDVAIGALQCGASDHGVPARLARLVDLVGDRLQPGPAVFVGQGMAGAHLGDIAGGMKLVAILEIPAQAFGKLVRDGALARAGHPHHDQRARHRADIIAHENSPAVPPCPPARSSRLRNVRGLPAGSRRQARASRSRVFPRR